MKFEYVGQPDLRNPQKPWVSRPFIPVRLFYKGELLNVYALVDSGADTCLFNKSVGEALGIDVNRGDKQIFYGIEAGGIDVYFHDIELQVIGAEEKIPVRAGFLDSDKVSGILGQQDFFDNYHITFEKDKETVEINPVLKRK